MVTEVYNFQDQQFAYYGSCVATQTGIFYLQANQYAGIKTDVRNGILGPENIVFDTKNNFLCPIVKEPINIQPMYIRYRNKYII